MQIPVTTQRTEMVRRWIVLRPEDMALMGCYADKSAALSAARRFAQDHCRYTVIEEGGHEAS